MNRMKSLSLCVLAVLLIAVPASSEPPAEPPAKGDQPAQHYAFKGMELYSWSIQENGKEVFYYDLTFGTNRRKFLEEIQSTPMTLEQVKAEIAKLPPGEHLSWVNEVSAPKTGMPMDLPLPPKETIEELIAAARARQIDLWVRGYSDP